MLRVNNVSRFQKSNGLIWQRKTILPYSATFRAIAASGTTWIASTGGSRVARSTDDGITWSEITLPITMGTVRADIGVNGNTWIMVSSGSFGGAIEDSDQAVRSTDNGATWSAITLPASAYWSSVAASGNTWVATNSYTPSSNSSNYVARSTDNGVTWSTPTLHENLEWLSVRASGNTWVATAADPSVAEPQFQCGARSTDNGATWSAITLPGFGRWEAIAVSGNTWITVGGFNPMMARSTDNGVNWTSLNPNPAIIQHAFRSIAVSGSTWVVPSWGGGAGRHLRSINDGVNWQPLPTMEQPGFPDYWSIAVGGLNRTTWLAAGRFNENPTDTIYRSIL
jgi:hypothetical protein